MNKSYGEYDDIINLPHHVSKKHPQMKAIDRAAQFAPFAALTGHGDAIRETERLTGVRIELDEYEKEIIRGRLQSVLEQTYRWNAEGIPVADRPKIKIKWFVPDVRKDGGQYRTETQPVKKMDEYRRLLVLGDGSEVSLDDIAGVEIMDSSDYTTPGWGI